MADFAPVHAGEVLHEDTADDFVTFQRVTGRLVAGAEPERRLIHIGGSAEIARCPSLALKVQRQQPSWCAAPKRSRLFIVALSASYDSYSIHLQSSCPAHTIELGEHVDFLRADTTPTSEETTAVRAKTLVTPPCLIRPEPQHKTPPDSGWLPSGMTYAVV